MKEKVFIYSFDEKVLSNDTLENKLDDLREQGIEITGYQIENNKLKITVSNINEYEGIALASVTGVTVSFVIMTSMMMLTAYFVRLNFVKVIDKIEDTDVNTKKFLLNITDYVKYGIILYVGRIAYNEYKKL